MTDSSSEIKLDGAFENFYEHFSKKDNSRILFTAPFGMGKTYFLNRFFKDFLNEKEKQNGGEAKEYQCIRVSPVNYVPSDNVTIFELIKVDILRQLFFCNGLKIDNKKLKSSYFKATLKYIKRQPLDLVDIVAEALPLLSIDPVTNPILSEVKDVTKSVTNLLKEIHKIKIENDQKIQPDSIKTEEYIRNMQAQKGSSIEFDLISEIIHQTITKSKKKFVLVVDDLDRLDPAHIFRILNIFSVHNNFEEKNKFGFDKVITVCDLGNIESIFAHFYGEKTKFNGYIDKFVSFHPYRFENFENIFSFISENNQISELKDFNYVLAVFVYDLIKKGRTDLRRVFSALKYRPESNGTINFHLKNDFYCKLNEQPIFYFAHFVRQLLPFEDKNIENNSDGFDFSIEVLKRGRDLEEQTFKLIGTFWVTVNFELHSGQFLNRKNFEFKSIEYSFKYSLEQLQKDDGIYLSNIFYSTNDGSTTVVNPYLSENEIKFRFLLERLFDKTVDLIKSGKL